MNATLGDVLNQGRYSIYVSNISEEGVLIQGNNLWVPREGTSRRRASSTTILRARWTSRLAAGALARSLAI